MERLVAGIERMRHKGSTDMAVDSPCIARSVVAGAGVEPGIA